MIRCAALLIAVPAFVATGLNVHADEPLETKRKLNGVWVAEKITSSGQVVPLEKFPFELHFTDKTLTFKRVRHDRAPDRVHDITLDNTKNPATIDIIGKRGDSILHVRGIYSFDGDRLLICSLRDENRRPSKERPKTFESSSEVPSDLLILKRKPDAE